MVLIDDNSTALSINDPMPEFVLKATDRMTVESVMIKDPVLVVVFTCNHCPYAQAYEDRLIALANEFDEEGCQFVLVSSNDAENYPEDSFDMMHKKHADKGYPFPYCFDEDQAVAKAFGALCTPHAFLCTWQQTESGSKQRVLKYKGRIDDNWENPEAVTEHNLHDAIAATLKGDEPPVHELNAIGCSIKWKS